MALIALWQWATVSANFGGNPTALFCTGALFPQPPLVRQEGIYIFPNSLGYDGQQYHLIAHDPFLRTDLPKYIDDARLRYRRILLPMAAWAVALGNSSRIDLAYGILCLLSIGLGVWWCVLLAQREGLAPAWGLLFLAIPAVPITADRLVTDGLLAALTAGLLYHVRRPSAKLFVILACAALTRETGFLLLAACVASFALWKDGRRALVYSLAGVPALAWYGFVHIHTLGRTYGDSMIPFSAIVRVLSTPWHYPAGTPLVTLVQAADYLAIGGMLLAFAWSFVLLARDHRDVAHLAAALFTLVAIVLQRVEIWENVYHYGRVFSPLFVCLTALAARYRRPALLLPAGMLLPRIAIQLTPQILGVLRNV
jgi:hypothetical protein